MKSSLGQEKNQQAATPNFFRYYIQAEFRNGSVIVNLERLSWNGFKGGLSRNAYTVYVHNNKMLHFGDLLLFNKGRLVNDML